MPGLNCKARGLLCCALMCAVLAAACTRIKLFRHQPTESETVKAVADQFCKLDAEGKWLRPENRGQLEELCDLDPSSDLSQLITVIQNYRVSAPRFEPGGQVYEVEVDYYLWGTIDPLLHFEYTEPPRGEKPPPGKPVEERIHQSVVPAAAFSRWSSSTKADHQQAQGGIPRWKLEMFSGPRVEVPAAISFVAAAAEKSSDPVVKYNAGRAITILRSLASGAPPPAPPLDYPRQSPSQVAHQFFDLELRSGPDQWDRLENFFLETPKPRWNQVVIVDHVGIGGDEAGRKANPETSAVRVEMDLLGLLDSSLKISHYPRQRTPPGLLSASACGPDLLLDLTMLLSELHWQVGSDGTVKEIKGPPAWRIEDSSFSPYLTLEAVIRYVTGQRAKATDAVVKKNADRTLTILNYYQRGKPLPNDLCAGGSLGCGG